MNKEFDMPTVNVNLLSGKGIVEGSNGNGNGNFGEPDWD